jgi:DMSO/TMAO reductase YedYZ molybdopterin-dependent catalytic subunit
VAGYFGTNSVKWLARISLAGTRPEGLFTTRLYNRRVERAGREHVEPAQERGPAPTWQRFGFEWDAAAPGSYEIRARATDSRAWVQPNRGRNPVHAIGVTIVQ